MVAKIKSGKSIIGALNYNEIKVHSEKAELLDAAGYLKEPFDLNFHEKLLRLTDLAARNERTKTNSVHISLNFASGEQINNDTLKQLTADYMSLIGFNGQPYLAYRHTDAGHPHLHIVTTNIRPSGERISLHLLGKTKSEQARKTLEIAYDLIKAEDRSDRQQLPERIALKKVEYGKAETKRAITNVINEVLRSYKFTSLPEMNAVLNLFNVTADRGSKDSRMFAKSGLVYWLQDEKGNKLGVPVKASSIYGKPTLKALHDRFLLGEELRKPLKEPLKQAIDKVLVKPLCKEQFQKELQEKSVQVVFRQNKEGRLYGITFIDQQSKAVFNGSDLGKNYSAAFLTGRFINSEIHPKQQIQQTHITQSDGSLRWEPPTNLPTVNGRDKSVLDILFTDQQDTTASIVVQQNKRKRKRKRPSIT